MKKLFFLFIFLIAFRCDAQTTFQKTYGWTLNESGSSVQQTNDGGFIIAGNINNAGAGSYDIYLIKTDAYGNTVWIKIFGGGDGDLAYSVQQTIDGGYIIGGNTKSFGAGYEDYYIIKTDASGNLTWSKSYGSAYNDYGYVVRQTSDGGYIIFGEGGFVPGGSIFYVKTDASGTILWTKIYRLSGSDKCHSIRQTNDGGYITVGSRLIGSGIGWDVLLIKTDGLGDTLWIKRFGGIGAGGDSGYSVEQTSDGGYIMTGVTWSFGAGLSDVYLIKTDENGNLLWSKTYGGGWEDWGLAVQETNDGGYIITGSTRSFGAGLRDVYLIKTDISGNLLWSKTYGGTDDEDSWSVKQTTDGGYIIAGFTDSYGIGGGMYLIKTDSLGNSGCNESNPATIVTNPSTHDSISTVNLLTGTTTTTIPLTYTQTGGYASTICYVGLAEANAERNLITLSPNPTSSQLLLTITNHLKPNTTASIYNFLGAEILTVPVTNSQTNINISALPAGVYFVNVKEGGRSVGVKKFVKI